MKKTILFAILILSIISCKKNETPIPKAESKQTVKLAPYDSNGCVTRAAIVGTWYCDSLLGLGNAQTDTMYHLYANNLTFIFTDSTCDPAIAKNGTHDPNAPYKVKYASDYSYVEVFQKLDTTVYYIDIIDCNRLSISYIDTSSFTGKTFGERFYLNK